MEPTRAWLVDARGSFGALQDSSMGKSFMAQDLIGVALLSATLVSCSRPNGQGSSAAQSATMEVQRVGFDSASEVAPVVTHDSNSGFAQESPREVAFDWAKADADVVRLNPRDFPEAPTEVREELQRRGCTIPQTYATQGPHNIVSGRFMSAHATDWAALCSRDHSSSLLVFPHGRADSVVDLGSSPDRQWLQGIGDGAIGFSHAIGVATPEYILDHHRESGGPAPPPLDHDGINDIFMEKASVVRYWHDGQWLALTGAD
jgi:hypothetical protein